MRQRPKSLEDEMVAIIDVGAGLCGCIIILREPVRKPQITLRKLGLVKPGVVSACW